MIESERRKLWVRAGGRCTLCKRYLLEGGLTFKEVPVGEGAHIVGQQRTPGSPRGMVDLPEADRDRAENILLVCSSCHTEIDKAVVAELMTVEELLGRKRAHEDEIRHQTGLSTDRRSTVLRMHGFVRGAAMDLTRDTAATAVIRSGDRFPFFMPAYDQQSIEIDLRHLDGEADGEASYYTAARRRIDDRVQKVHEGLLAGQINHLSVFAIARLPLLVYLGWALEDGVAVDVYQRHRRTDDWLWPAAGAPTSFSVTQAREASGTSGAGSTDAALITNLSGTTSPERLPTSLAAAPVFLLRPEGAAAYEDVIDSPQTLGAFESTLRRFFSDLEVTGKDLQRLQVFGALPVSAAVTFGRCLKARDLRPAVMLHDLTSDGYRAVMEI